MPSRHLGVTGTPHAHRPRVMGYPHRLTFEPLDPSDEGYTLVAHNPLTAQTLTLRVKQLRWQGSHFCGHLTLQADDETTLVIPVFGLTDFQQRNAVLNVLDRLAWGPALNRLCNEVMAQQGSRLRAVRLVDLPLEEAPANYWSVGVLPPVIFDDLTVWFGDGGVGKSYLALYAAGQLAIQGFHVLYCDWEMSGARHRHRLFQLFGEEEPETLFYVECDAPLVQIGAELNVMIEQNRVDYLVVDSVARACQGDAERNDVATAYLNRAKAFGLGSLHVAHVTKQGAQMSDKPFGSVFWHNGARETWNVTTAPEHNQDNAVGLVMRQRKSNLAAPNTTPYVLQLLSEGGRMWLQTPSEVASEPQVGMARTLVREALRSGPLTRDELRARCASLRQDTFRQALHRERTAGTVIEVAEGLLALSTTLPSEP